MSGDYGREKKHKRNESREIQNQEEITELHSIVMELMDKIEELHRNRSQTRIPFASPDTSASIKKAWNNLEPMNKDYKKIFWISICIIALKFLDASLQLDYKNRYTDIKIYVIQNVILAIKRAFGKRFHYTDTELKKVLQNYHRHQRDTYILLLNPQKQKANRQRTGINSRRKDKKERCQRGLKRIINTKDQMLTDLEFSNLIKDLRKIINDSNYHSDEVSEIDEEEDNSKPPRNAPEWAILSSYQSK
ncbi:hypothetical protein GLOIN_2v1792113 [Rhizophagus irregularis DAOM 181602=DAOM 197198]|nr:hypothetical protein GLOIN_2v1792113 [Rhizophagus irregularis DAOM 181602=DAOM 197198]